MENNFIKNIEEALNSLNQKNMFNSNPEKVLEEACTCYLKYKGYTIVDPKKFEKRIDKLDDLINYFYLLLSNKHPESYTGSYSLVKDRAIAKRFVESRMSATGVSKKYALNECGAIIKTVFDHESEFNFRFPLTFALFGQNKLGWVTDKAVAILNKQEENKREAYSKELRRQAIESQDMSDLGIGNLDDILASMEEDEDAKKK